MASTIFTSVTEELSELKRAFEIQSKEFGARVEKVHREASERDSKLSSRLSIQNNMKFSWRARSKK